MTTSIPGSPALAAEAATAAPTGTAKTTRARTAPLLWLVFLAGMGSMAIEMGASRLLAPFYGSSTIVWANIIGLVLASLSLGYWLGGRIADRWPEARLLGYIVLAAAVVTAIVPFIARPLLGLSVRALDTVSAGAIIGSLLGSLFLFVPPVVLLGMVTPFAIRLSVPAVEDAGRTAGRIFALSTVGSL
ncbi:MAG: fused MFS/spermidine synthase, partial [Actinobacteria bacterium]|nr:fused MFS/spermidine synthase [Actinomycetota bacterium]